MKCSHFSFASYPCKTKLGFIPSIIQAIRYCGFRYWGYTYRGYTYLGYTCLGYTYCGFRCKECSTFPQPLFPYL